MEGRNAVLQHDINLFNLFIDLGEAPHADVKSRVPLHELDFRDLDMPAFDVKNGRLTQFDFGTALYFSMVFLVIFADPRVIEKAVNSFQWDDQLMNILADMTGDDAFRYWTPVRFETWFGTPTWDPPRDLHWHFLVHERAYYKLRELRDSVHVGSFPAN
ncbi:MAG: hypothetical protein R3A47_11950 [Polyangiales bacterium]